LRWRVGFLGSRWRQVGWEVVRASGRLARLDVSRNRWEHEAHTYFLDISDVLLTWGVNPFESAAGGAYTPKEMKSEWEAFASLISARSGLPLRDITPVAQAVARATDTSRSSPHIGTSRDFRNGARRGYCDSGREVQSLHLLRAFSWVPLALFVALYIAGAIIQLRS
jgi:hypothetical protein